MKTQWLRVKENGRQKFLNVAQVKTVEYITEAGKSAYLYVIAVDGVTYTAENSNDNRVIMGWPIA